MHAFKSPRLAPNASGMKARNQTRANASRLDAAGRVVSLTGVETLSEKDFDQFVRNMQADHKPTQAAMRAAHIHKSIRAVLKP